MAGTCVPVATPVIQEPQSGDVVLTNPVAAVAEKGETCLWSVSAPAVINGLISFAWLKIYNLTDSGTVQ